MRVVHISILFSRGRMKGVQEKLSNMANAAKEADLPIDFVLINRERSGADGALNLIFADELMGRWTGLKLRALKYKYLGALVSVGGYSAIVLRYHYADPSMPFFMRRYGEKVFFEHHTKELKEIWRSGLSAPVKFYQYLQEILIAPYCLRKAKGIVAVTQEFLDHQKIRANLPPSQPKFVMSNGAVFSNNEVVLLPVLDVVRIVFVADRFRPWHGLSRLMSSLEAYNGDVVVELVLVGQLDRNQMLELKSADTLKGNIRVDLRGPLRNNDLFSVLQSCHLAIDSLATYELGMSESSTLKVRLYLEVGIPWVSATPDVDVGEDARLCYVVPNNRSKLPVDRVVQWRKELDEMQFVSVVRQLRKVVDWRVKLTSLNSWLSESLHD